MNWWMTAVLVVLVGAVCLRIGWRLACRRESRWSYQLSLPDRVIRGEGLTLADVERVKEEWGRYDAAETHSRHVEAWKAWTLGPFGEEHQLEGKP